MLSDATISAIASPDSTSPPTVFNRSNSPSTSFESSISANFGRTCSYFVVLVLAESVSCPSTSPITESKCILCCLSFLSKSRCPSSLLFLSSPINLLLVTVFSFLQSVLFYQTDPDEKRIENLTLYPFHLYSLCNFFQNIFEIRF